MLFWNMGKWGKHKQKLNFSIKKLSYDSSSQKFPQRRRLYIFIHESLCHKLRKDLSINSEATESLSIEISDKKASSLIFNAIYRPPTGDKNIWTILQRYIFKKPKHETHQGRIQRFWKSGALYVGHHGRPTKKILGFRWSKKAKITLETKAFGETFLSVFSNFIHFYI